MDDLEQPGGSRVSVSGAKERGGRGVYMGQRARENREQILTNLIRNRLGFRCCFLAREVEGDDVIAGVIGGTHLAVREREVG